MSAERPLVEWARRVQNSCSGGSQTVRERLEATLVPMIRCAITSGLGQPTLVRWVRDRLPLMPPDQQNDLAGPLARQLSDSLLARLDPLPQRETVLGH